MLKRAYTNLQIIKNYIVILIFFIILSFGLIFLGELVAPSNVQWIFVLLRYIIAITFLIYINKKILKNVISFKVQKNIISYLGWIIAVIFIIYNLWGLTQVSPINFNTNTEKENLLFCVGPGIFEELWFRGFIFYRLFAINQKKKLGIIVAVVVSSLLFMISHLIIPDYSSFKMMMWQAIESLGLGILFATIYYVTQNLGLSMLMHFSWDFSTYFISWQFSFLYNLNPSQVNILYFSVYIVISIILLICKNLSNKKQKFSN